MVQDQVYREYVAQLFEFFMVSHFSPSILFYIADILSKTLLSTFMRLHMTCSLAARIFFCPPFNPDILWTSYSFFGLRKIGLFPLLYWSWKWTYLKGYSEKKQILKTILLLPTFLLFCHYSTALVSPPLETAPCFPILIISSESRGRNLKELFRFTLTYWILWIQLEGWKYVSETVRWLDSFFSS